MTHKPTKGLRRLEQNKDKIALCIRLPTPVVQKLDQLATKANMTRNLYITHIIKQKRDPHA